MALMGNAIDLSSWTGYMGNMRPSGTTFFEQWKEYEGID